MKKGRMLLISFLAILLSSIGLLYMCVKTNKSLVDNDFEYILNKDNNVSIISYKGNGKKVFIPSKIKGNIVSEIRKDTFTHCNKLRAVYIPKSISKIDEDLFNDFSDVIIYGYTQSYAYDYALRKDLPFMKVEDLHIDKFNTDCLSPQLTGTSIKLFAEAGGGMGDLNYTYEVYKNGKLMWQQDCGNSSEATWLPLESGEYDINLTVKDGSNNIVDMNKKFFIKEGMNIVDFYTGLSSPQPVDRLISIDSTVINGYGKVLYKYIIKKNGIITWTRDYSSEKIAIWNPKEEGDYTIFVTAVDENNVYCTKSLDFTIKELIFIDDFSCNLDSPQEIGKNIEFKASISGGNGKVKYRFQAKKDDEICWDSGMNDSNKAVWVPKEGGYYTITVKVEDEEGNTSEKNIIYYIKKDLIITGYRTDLESPQMVGSKINIIANAIGETCNIKYKFVVMKNKKEVWSREFSNKNIATWSPKDDGKYEILVYVSDGENMLTKKIGNYEIAK